MFKWWFLLVFLPNLRNDLIYLIFLITVITLFLGIGFIIKYFEDGLDEECLKIGKFLKKSIVSIIILLIAVSILPNKRELVEMFAANTFLTKDNTELISKIPNKSLKYLDKIIQERIKEIDKKGN